MTSASAPLMLGIDEAAGPLVAVAVMLRQKQHRRKDCRVKRAERNNSIGVKKAGPTNSQGSPFSLRIRDAARTIARSAGWCGTQPMKPLAMIAGRCRSLSQTANSLLIEKPASSSGRMQTESDINIDAAVLVQNFVAHQVGDAFPLASGAKHLNLLAAPPLQRTEF